MHTRKGLGGFFFPNPTAQRRLTDASKTGADESDDGIKNGGWEKYTCECGRSRNLDFRCNIDPSRV